MENEIRDLYNIIRNRDQYKRDVSERFADALSGFVDLIGTGRNDMSLML